MAGEWLKRASDFLARLPGLPTLVGIGLIILNLVLQLLPPWPIIGWMAQVNLLLHLGLVASLIGLLLIRAL
ncbi:MAG: hypothetical protein PVH62_02045 [Anaerolineae bacterium]